MTNTDLAQEFLNRLNSGDLTHAAALLAPDFQFQGPFGEERDRDALIAVFQGMGPVFRDYAMEITGVTAEGDRVALEAVGQGVLRTGAAYANRYHFLFEIRDGAIRRWREYCDTRALAAIFGPDAA